MTDDQIKYMVDRFLGWRLPENFTPDAGISFTPTFNDHLPVPMKHEPVGTNLFDASQAEQMVRYMVDGIPAPEPLGCEPKGCPTPGACSCPPTASLLVKEAAMLAVNEIGAELGLYSSIGDHQHANEIVCKHFAGFTHSPVMADAEAAAKEIADNIKEALQHIWQATPEQEQAVIDETLAIILKHSAPAAPTGEKPK